MPRFRILNPISCSITYSFGVLIFMNRLILLLNAREIMKHANTFVRVVYIHYSSFNSKDIYIYLNASLASAARLADTVSARGDLWTPVVPLINYLGDNISKYACP